MTTFNNWRFNPFTGTTHATAVTAELHTIEYQDEWNAYGIQLDEAPQLDSPSTVEIIDNDTLASFTEVPRSVAPSAGQFRVDYDAATYYGTGRIQFNAADTGKTVSVNYYGTGTVVKNNYRQLQVTTFPTAVTFEEDVTFDADALRNGNDITYKSSNLNLIEDPIFKKGFWTGGTIVDDTVNSGTTSTLKIIANSSTQTAECAPLGSVITDGYSCRPGDIINIVLSMRRDASLNGTTGIRLVYYDSSGSELAGETYTITNSSDLGLSYEDFVFPLSVDTSQIDAYYAKLNIILNNSATTGNLFIAYAQGANVQCANPEAIKNRILADGYASTLHQYPVASFGAGNFVPIYSGVYNLTAIYADYDIDGTEAFPYAVKSVLIRYFADHSGASATAQAVFRDKSGNAITLGGTVNATSVNDSINYYGMAVVNVRSYTADGKAELSGLYNGTSGSFYVHGFFI